MKSPGDAHIPPVHKRQSRAHMITYKLVHTSANALNSSRTTNFAIIVALHDCSVRERLNHSSAHNRAGLASRYSTQNHCYTPSRAFTSTMNLGHDTSADMPPKQAIFAHAPLTDATAQIRLLRLVPGSSKDDLLRYEINVYNIEDAPEYRAISYAWGESMQESEIVVDQRWMRVRQTCRYALWQTSLHLKDSLLWIDSICINQEDLQEKSIQVQMMGTIYRKAVLVAASLGRHAAGSERICAYDETLAKYKFKGEETFEEDYPRLRKPFRAFVQRPFWRRLWIVQELYLVPHAWFMCGHDVIKDWKTTHAHMFAESKQTYELLSAYTRLDFPFKILMWEKLKRHQPEAFTLLEAIDTFKFFACQDGRDHVFALLNLCRSGHESIKVDYQIPLSLLAINVLGHAGGSCSAYQVYDVVKLLEIMAGEPVSSACSLISGVGSHGVVFRHIEPREIVTRRIMGQVRGKDGWISKMIRKSATKNISRWSRMLIRKSCEVVLQNADMCMLRTCIGTTPCLSDDSTLSRSDVQDISLLLRQRTNTGSMSSTDIVTRQGEILGQLHGMSKTGDVLLELLSPSKSTHCYLYVLLRESVSRVHDVVGWATSSVKLGMDEIHRCDFELCCGSFMLTMNGDDLLMMVGSCMSDRSLKTIDCHPSMLTARSRRPALQSYAYLLSEQMIRSEVEVDEFKLATKRRKIAEKHLTRKEEEEFKDFELDIRRWLDMRSSGGGSLVSACADDASPGASEVP